MMKELSNCCNAGVKVDSSDEGTSCYVCTQCNKPCDLQMKEQVSVDDNTQDNFEGYLTRTYPAMANYRLLNIEECERLKRLQAENTSLKNFITYLYHEKTGKPNDMEFNIDELVRLKRLDDNIQTKIALYKQCYNGNFGSSYQQRVEYLESLYK
jgi:uncharacterized protein (UPF0335 family)